MSMAVSSEVEKISEIVAVLYTASCCSFVVA